MLNLMIWKDSFLEFLTQLMCASNSPTIILVTHHIEEIFPAYTHVCLMKKGKILAQGPKSTPA